MTALIVAHPFLAVGFALVLGNVAGLFAVRLYFGDRK